jgi:hypothetical protein
MVPESKREAESEMGEKREPQKRHRKTEHCGHSDHVQEGRPPKHGVAVVKGLVPAHFVFGVFVAPWPAAVGRVLVSRSRAALCILISHCTVHAKLQPKAMDLEREAGLKLSRTCRRSPSPHLHTHALTLCRGSDGIESTGVEGYCTRGCNVHASSGYMIDRGT